MQKVRLIGSHTYLGLTVIFLEIENNVSVPFIYSEKLYLAMNFLCICVVDKCGFACSVSRVPEGISTEHPVNEVVNCSR